MSTLRVHLEIVDKGYHTMRTFPDPNKYGNRPYLDNDGVIRFIKILHVTDKNSKYKIPG